MGKKAPTGKCLRCGYDLIQSMDLWCPLCVHRERRFRQVSPEGGRGDGFSADFDDPAVKADCGYFDLPKRDRES